MKIISIILFGILFSQATSYAKARYAGKNDMIQEARCIDEIRAYTAIRQHVANRERLSWSVKGIRLRSRLSVR